MPPDKDIEVCKFFDSCRYCRHLLELILFRAKFSVGKLLSHLSKRISVSVCKWWILNFTKDAFKANKKIRYIL